MYYIGIDIGSTCAKLVVLNDEHKVVVQEVQPTGWSSVDTAEKIKEQLILKGINPANNICVATGYGRISVPYANKTITEITCHALGATTINNMKNALVIDIGGQDTKVIRIENYFVKDFIMNDKCSAGTGRFLEVMANSMGLRPDELCVLAKQGGNVTISSMCTVFAESEVISLIGRGESKENIAYAVVDSIVSKVVSQASRLHQKCEPVCLTGGLCECEYVRKVLENKLHSKVITNPESRYAGALGAALSAIKLI